MDGPAVGSARSLMTRSGNRAGFAKIEKQLIHVFALMSRIKSGFAADRAERHSTMRCELPGRCRCSQ